MELAKMAAEDATDEKASFWQTCHMKYEPHSIRYCHLLFFVRYQIGFYSKRICRGNSELRNDNVEYY